MLVREIIDDFWNFFTLFSFNFVSNIIVAFKL